MINITKLRATIYIIIQQFLLYLLRLLRSKRRIHNLSQTGKHIDELHSHSFIDQHHTSIIISTFEARFFNYAIPLIKSLRTQIALPIFVVINGNYNASQNNIKLQEFIIEIGKYKDIYPIAFSNFRGCAELWNTGIVHADTEFFIILNDDIHIYPKLFKESMHLITQSIDEHRLVTINRSFSHFGISRKCIEDVGFFDEHFLGIGEEDRDYFYRYESIYAKQPFNLSLDAFFNLSDLSSDNLIKKMLGSKYSQFNSNIQKEFYTIDHGSPIQGRFELPVTRTQVFTNPRPIWEFRKINYKKLVEG